MKPSLRTAQARAYYRKWPTNWLLKKRARLVARLLAIEDVCAERGYPVLPGKVREMLRLMLREAKEQPQEVA
jgi:hypothetical protein